MESPPNFLPNMQHTPNTKLYRVLDSWLKFGTVFLVYRLCTYLFFDKCRKSFFDKQTLILIFILLIGFAIYYSIFTPHIPDNYMHPLLRNLENDMLMFGTVLVTSHVIEASFSDCDYFNKEWLKTAGIIMLAFATYDIIVYPFVPGNTAIAHDWVKYGTFLIIFRFLQGGKLDQKWMLSVLFALLGFTSYHFVTKKLVKK